MIKLNIERATIKNNNYRKVLSTTSTQQLVLMAIPPGVEIGDEVHPETTQFIKVEKGCGVAVVDNSRYILKPGDSLTVPPGAWHNIWSSNGTTPLKLYSIYSPPEHPDGLVQKVKPS